MAGLRPAALALGLLAVAAPLRAEIELQSIRWQSARWEATRGREHKAQDLAVLRAEPGKRLRHRVLARLTVRNRGPAEHGVLLRYTVTGKIAPLDGSQPAAWALPFLVEERRVPGVKANSVEDVLLDPTVLVDLYLKKVHRAGWWPVELRLQVQIEPRLGQKLPLRTIESTLPVAKP